MPTVPWLVALILSGTMMTAGCGEYRVGTHRVAAPSASKTPPQPAQPLIAGSDMGGLGTYLAVTCLGLVGVMVLVIATQDDGNAQ